MHTLVLLKEGCQQALLLAVGVSPGQGVHLVFCYPQSILHVNVGYTFYNTLDEFCFYIGMSGHFEQSP